MSREILIPHGEISNSQTITQVMEQKFRENDLDMHRHEVTDLQDDDKRRVRKLTVKNSRYFSVGRVPWHEK